MKLRIIAAGIDKPLFKACMEGAYFHPNRLIAYLLSITLRQSLFGPWIMENAPRYWTKTFIDRYVEALNGNEAFGKVAQRFRNVVILRCLDTPDGKDVVAAYKIDCGNVSVVVDLDDAPSVELRARPFDSSAGLARATAPYDIWCGLDRGELTVLSALTSPDYHIEGSSFKIMLNLGVISAMNDVAAGMTKTY